MRNAYNNLRGWCRDVAAARQAAYEGDKGAGELLDLVCDELDVLLDFGGEDDGAGDGGHDDGGEQPPGMASDSVAPGNPQGPAGTVDNRGTVRVSSVRRGTTSAHLGPRPGAAGGGTTVVPRRGA